MGGAAAHLSGLVGAKGALGLPEALCPASWVLPGQAGGPRHPASLWASAFSSRIWERSSHARSARACPWSEATTASCKGQLGVTGRRTGRAVNSQLFDRVRATGPRVQGRASPHSPQRWLPSVQELLARPKRQGSGCRGPGRLWGWGTRAVGRGQGSSAGAWEQSSCCPLGINVPTCDTGCHWSQHWGGGLASWEGQLNSGV